MATTNTETLEAKIEAVVREHLAAQQLAARAAVERAFARLMPARPAAFTRVRGGYRRREPAQLAELAERLIEAVQACPGETMAVIAPRVGQKPTALHRPMQQLKEAGRVRSAGERNFTRYFPMGVMKTG
jgi:hypothetical protein